MLHPHHAARYVPGCAWRKSCESWQPVLVSQSLGFKEFVPTQSSLLRLPEMLNAYNATIMCRPMAFTASGNTVVIHDPHCENNGSSYCHGQASHLCHAHATHYA